MVEKILYYEDLIVGHTFTNGGYTIDKEHAIAFAKEYDPQYFHTDEKAAKKSIFGKLAVCGTQTVAISMHLKMGTDLAKVSGGLVGLGMESLKWPRPVYPGDTLRLVVTITKKRVSKTNPKQGVVYYGMQTFNQNDVLVMKLMTAVLVPLRPVN